MEELGNAFRITMYRRPFETDEFGVKNPKDHDSNDTTQSAAHPTQSPTHPTHSDQFQTSNSADWKLTPEETELLDLLEASPMITQSEMADQLGWNVNRVKYYLNKFRTNRLIRHDGHGKDGRWIVNIRLQSQNKIH